MSDLDMLNCLEFTNADIWRNVYLSFKFHYPSKSNDDNEVYLWERNMV